MKHCQFPGAFIVAISFLLSATDNLAAQKHFDVNLAHNWNFLDRDIELSAERTWHKIGVKAGLNFFQYTITEPLRWEHSYAANFGQSVGFHAAFLYHIALHDSNVELAPYFKFAAFHIGNLLYTGNGLHEKAYFKSNTSLGIQVKTKLSGRLYLLASAEAGARWEEASSFNLSGKGLEFNGISTGGSVGLAWRFKK